MYKIPLQEVPNQVLSTTLDGVTWFITLETRLDNLYISLRQDDKDVLFNRICLDKTPIGYGFVFVDIDGDEDPIYTGLRSRFNLIWVNPQG